MSPGNAAATPIPKYRDLPTLEGTDLRHAWDVFGRDASRGTLDWISPEQRRCALAAVRSGETFGLTMALDRPDQPPYGRSRLRHELIATNSFSWSEVLELDTQASSQWDGLLHVAHREHGFFGGRRGVAGDFPELGIGGWAETGVIGRGVLLDLADHLGFDPLERFEVTAPMLREVLSAQEVELQPGDILCVRFGWPRAYAGLPEEERATLMARPACAGLSAAAETAELLWDARVAAVAADNPTVEVQPGDKAVGFLHHRLLTTLGMPLGEMFDFDALAAHLRRERRWTFLFTAVPLNVTGGVGSPANAVAVV